MADKGRWGDDDDGGVVFLFAENMKIIRESCGKFNLDTLLLLLPRCRCFSARYRAEEEEEDEVELLGCRWPH